MGDLPIAIWSGSFKLFGVEIKCHTLSDGQRIIEADSMARLLEAWSEPSDNDYVEFTEDVERFAKWHSGTPLDRERSDD